MSTVCIFFLLLWIIESAGRPGNFYDALEVTKSSSQEQIRKQYRQLAKKYHPDKNDSPEAQEKFLEITKAYETLSDDHKRREYDEALKYGGESSQNRFHGQQRHRNFHSPFPDDFFDRSQSSNTFMFRDAHGRVFFSSSGFPGHQRAHEEDIFNSFFQHMRPKPVPWYQILYQMLISNPLIAFLALFLVASLCLPTPSTPQKKQRGNRNSNSDGRTPQRCRENDVTVENAEMFRKASENKAALLQRGYIAVVSAFEDDKKLLISLKRKFFHDRLSFFVHHLPFHDRKQGDLVAISKGGERWCCLSYDEAGISADASAEERSALVEQWLLKLIAGEAKWTTASTEPVPYSLLD